MFSFLTEAQIAERKTREYQEKEHDIAVARELVSNNEFIRCFHQFVSRIFSMNFSQFEQLKKKANFLLVQKRFFFLSLAVEKEIIR